MLHPGDSFSLHPLRTWLLTVPLGDGFSMYPWEITAHPHPQEMASSNAAKTVLETRLKGVLCREPIVSMPSLVGRQDVYLGEASNT